MIGDWGTEREKLGKEVMGEREHCQREERRKRDERDRRREKRGNRDVGREEEDRERERAKKWGERRKEKRGAEEGGAPTFPSLAHWASTFDTFVLGISN